MDLFCLQLQSTPTHCGTSVTQPRNTGGRGSTTAVEFGVVPHLIQRQACQIRTRRKLEGCLGSTCAQPLLWPTPSVSGGRSHDHRSSCLMSGEGSKVRDNKISDVTDLRKGMSLSANQNLPVSSYPTAGEQTSFFSPRAHQHGGRILEGSLKGKCRPSTSKVTSFPHPWSSNIWVPVLGIWNSLVPVFHNPSNLGLTDLPYEVYHSGSALSP